ncbi:LysR substrate-binding domain-containing protein [Spongorhabdus nitratireducens]
MHITLRQLQIFRAIAQNGRVTAAANQLSISQPAASMALNELEKHLGPLFDRHQGASLTLNDSGRALLSSASELVDRAQEIESQFVGSGYETGTLKIDASSTIGNNIMPRMLVAFSDLYPGIHTDLHIDNTQRIVERLAGFKIDMAVVEGTCLHPDIEVQTWGEDELVIICAPDHPLANTEVELEALRDERWILREPGAGTRDLFNEFIAGRLGAPKICLQLNRAEAVKQAVADGLGLGCISKLAVWRLVKAGELAIINVSDLVLKRHFYLLFNKKKYRSGMICNLSEFILRHQPSAGMTAADFQFHATESSAPNLSNQ